MVGNYYLMTKEQYEEMIEGDKDLFDKVGFRPLRFMHRSMVPGDVLHFMRYYSQYYNKLCVWHLEQQEVVAISDSNLVLTYDPVAPSMYEFYHTIRDQGHGRTLMAHRRRYDYPHPSGRYQGASAMYSEGKGTDHDKADSG